jgi:hypothetical protein
LKIEPASLAVSAGSVRRWTWGPPGILFFLGAGVAVLAALDASSRQAFSMAVMAQVAWALVALIWLIRFAGALWSKRLRLPAMDWLRWLAIPAVLALVFLYTSTDAPFNLRLSLSRGAMNQAAIEVVAGGSTDRGWIGLYPVQRVERIANGMRFLIADSGFIDRVGLAYSTSAQPDGITGTDEYQSLGDGWWLWVERFN